MAVEEPGTRGVDLVSEDHPGSISLGGGACVTVNVWWVDEVEWISSGLGIGDRGEVEVTDTRSDHVELVGVLVDGVRLGNWASDLDDQINPLVHECLNYEIRLGNVGRVLVQQWWGPVVTALVVGFDPAESPCPRVQRLSRALQDVKNVADIGGSSNRGSWERSSSCWVERNQSSEVATSIVHGSSTEEASCTLVGQDTEARDDLVDTKVRNADLVVTRGLVKLDEEADTVATGNIDLVDNLWNDEATVVLVDVQLVAVDGNLEESESRGVDQGDGLPSSRRVNREGVVGSGVRRARVVCSIWESCQVLGILRTLDQLVVRWDATLGGQRRAVQDLGNLRGGVGSEDISTWAVGRTLAVDDDRVRASIVDVRGLLDLKQLFKRELAPVGDEESLGVKSSLGHLLNII